MQVICGIYFYRDLKEDEIVYVGQSRDIYQRHRGHLVPSSYDEQPINRIIQNDPARYILEIERRCSPNELNDLEIMYIKLLQPKFNFTSGGDFIPSNTRKGRYTLWDNKKTYYISHENQSRNRPFRLYWFGFYVACGYFETWFEAELIWNIIEEESQYEIK